MLGSAPASRSLAAGLPSGIPGWDTVDLATAADDGSTLYVTLRMQVIFTMAEVRYSRESHTPEALVAQLDVLTSNHPEAVIVGSIGRAAILGDQRTLGMRRRGGAARDIDMTATTGNPLVFSSVESAPFSVDSSFERLIAVDPSSSTATVRYDARRPDIAVQLPAEVFAPFPAVIGSLPVKTFHPDTMRRLHLIYDSIGPRDRRGLQEFEQRLRQVAYRPLPDRYFEPLVELARMVVADPQLRLQRRLERLQGLYIDGVPFPVRQRVDPLLQFVKSNFILRDRAQSSPNDASAKTRVSDAGHSSKHR